MTHSYKLLFFLDSALRGILSPVLSLLLLSRGADLATLPLFIALLSLTVLLAELPSGIFADLCGRSSCYLLSLIFMAAHSFIMLSCCSPAALALGCVLHGLALAFSSGSLEALVIDKAAPDRQTRVSSQILIFSSCGLALGSGLGGALAALDRSLRLLLWLCLSLSFGLIMLSFFVLPKDRQQRKKSFRSVPGLQLREILRLLSGAKILRGMLLASIAVGMIQTVVEVYWQQSFLLCCPEDAFGLIGAVGFLGYLGVILGGRIAEKLSFGKDAARFFWLWKFCLPPAVICLGSSRGFVPFVLLYALVYILLGGSELSEKLKLHRELDPRCRASMLSFQSLLIRFGGIASSLFSSLLITTGGLGAIWLLPQLFALMFLIFLAMYSKKQDN